MNILLVKMSSLGDIVHTLPAVQDAARRGARFDWVVEENYRAVPALAQNVDAVVPVALRRWRRAPLRHAREIGAFHRRLRSRRYDLVLDAQGLVKSAVVARLANARERAGFDAAGARERLATLGYRRRLRVSRRDHAIARARQLFAHALGYEAPSTPPTFGLREPAAAGERAAAHRRDLVLAHGATWGTKLWPETFWVDLARLAAAAGLRPLLPWQGDEEARARRIAAAVPEAVVCPPVDLAGMLRLVARARGVVGVDSGLAHFAAALGRPTVMVFGATDPALTGCQGPRARNLAGSPPCAPCLSRRCRFPSPLGVRNAPPCLAAVPPQRAWSALDALLEMAPAPTSP